MKTSTYHIVMSNTGGELDRKIIDVPDGSDAGAWTKTALMDMIADCAFIEPGDTFTVMQA